MKQLLAGIVIILVVGIGGFLYRNEEERPKLGANEGATGTQACTQEAKICPDGSAVGRTGADCAFAACPFPNAEDAAIGISFVVPTGYVANADAIGADETLRAVFDKPSAGSVPNSIIIRDYPISEGKTADEVMVANTTFESSGNAATSTSQFKSVTIGTNTFHFVTLERFEGQVHSAYYLQRAHDVLKFEVLEKDVTNWSDPKLDVRTLSEHKALEGLLQTLQLSTQ